MHWDDERLCVRKATNKKEKGLKDPCLVTVKVSGHIFIKSETVI